MSQNRMAVDRQSMVPIWQDGPDRTGSTDFWRAAQAKELSAMDLLVAAGANPDIATTHRSTPLQTAEGMVPARGLGKLFSESLKAKAEHQGAEEHNPKQLPP